MRTPEDIIGADAVAALEAEGYTVEEKETYPLRTHWVDAEGKEHPIEHYAISHHMWRAIYGPGWRSFENMIRPAAEIPGVDEAGNDE